MKQKDILKIKEQLIIFNMNLKSLLAQEGYIKETIETLGYNVWLLNEIDTILNSYNHIKQLVEECYFGENEDALDLKACLKSEIGIDPISHFYIKRELPIRLIEYIKSFSYLQGSLDEGLGTILNELPRYKMIEGKAIQMSEEEIRSSQEKREKEYQRISDSVLNWKKFYDQILNYINSEKYGKLLDFIFN